MKPSSDLHAQHLHPFLGPFVFIMFTDREKQAELAAHRRRGSSSHLQVLNLSSLAFKCFEEKSSSIENLQILKLN
jgi:hypothetical protein